MPSCEKNGITFKEIQNNKILFQLFFLQTLVCSFLIHLFIKLIFLSTYVLVYNVYTREVFATINISLFTYISDSVLRRSAQVCKFKTT